MRCILPFLAFVAIFLASGTEAATESKDQRVLNTAYFSIDIPAGWRMPAPLREQPFGGVSAAFVKENSDIAVTLNFLRADIPAAKFAGNMAQDMQKNGMKASRPIAENGLYKFNISGKANGVAWVGSDGGVCAVTIVFGANPGEAAQLLKAVKTANRNLLPASPE